MKNAAVVLIVPLSKTIYGNPRYPVYGLSILAGVLKKAGFNVKAFDLRINYITEKNIDDYCKKNKLLFFGICATNWDILSAVKLTDSLKIKYPDIPVIVGGPHISLYFDEIIKRHNPKFDLMVLGEGENIIIEIAERLSAKTNLKNINGSVFFNEQGEYEQIGSLNLIPDLNNLPLPAFEVFGLENYFTNKNRRLPLLTSRGCPYSCSFCTDNILFGKKVRYRSPELILEEIKYWITEHNVNHFGFIDDNLFIDKRHAFKLLKLIEESGLKFTYSLDTGIRANCAEDEELWVLLKKTGCVLVGIGIESSDQEVLKLCNKGENLEHISRAIALAKKFKITVKGYFIVGLPGDSAEKVKKSVEYAKKMKIDIPRFALAQAFPKTQLSSWIEKNGKFTDEPYNYVITNTDDQHTSPAFSFAFFSEKDIWTSYQWANKEALKITFKTQLEKMFGKIITLFLNPLLNNSLIRKISIFLYQKGVL